MQTIAMTSATDANGVEFTATGFERNMVNDMSLVPMITGANWNGGNVVLHVQRPGGAEWFDTGVILNAASPAAVVRMREGYKYRLVPTIPGGTLLLTFMLH